MLGQRRDVCHLDTAEVGFYLIALVWKNFAMLPFFLIYLKTLSCSIVFTYSCVWVHVWVCGCVCLLSSYIPLKWSSNLSCFPDEKALREVTPDWPHQTNSTGQCFGILRSEMCNLSWKQNLLDEEVCLKNNQSGGVVSEREHKLPLRFMKRCQEMPLEKIHPCL